MQMIRWIGAGSMKDIKTSEELRKSIGVEPITTVIRSGRLRWYGHVMMKSDEDWVKKCVEYRVEGRIPVGRPRKWLESVEADMTELKTNEEDVYDRKSSKKTQSARGWNATDICTNCVNTTLPPDMGAQFRFRPSHLAAWLAVLLTKAGDVESNPGPTTHTNKHAPVIWTCDLCHKQTKKQQQQPYSDVTTHTTHTGFI